MNYNSNLVRFDWEETVTKYFNILKSLWQDLDMYNDYEWKSPDDCNHHKKLVENNRVFKFLAGLNVEFDEVEGGSLADNHFPQLGKFFLSLEGRRAKGELC